jgi:hypothetical protein
MMKPQPLATLQVRNPAWIPLLCAIALPVTIEVAPSKNKPTIADFRAFKS